MTMLLAVLIFAAIVVAVVSLRGGRATSLVPSAPPDQAEVQRLIAAGETLEAIKMYRALTGLGLYEAKQAVDRIHASGAWEAPAVAPAAESEDAVAALVRENKIIEAIKLYREKHGVDLLTAKNAVDKLVGR